MVTFESCASFMICGSQMPTPYEPAVKPNCATGEDQDARVLQRGEQVPRFALARARGDPVAHELPLFDGEKHRIVRTIG